MSQFLVHDDPRYRAQPVSGTAPKQSQEWDDSAIRLLSGHKNMLLT